MGKQFKEEDFPEAWRAYKDVAVARGQVDAKHFSKYAVAMQRDLIDAINKGTLDPVFDPNSTRNRAVGGFLDGLARLLGDPNGTLKQRGQ